MHKLTKVLFLTIFCLLSTFFSCKDKKVLTKALLESWQALKGDYKEIVFSMGG